MRITLGMISRQYNKNLNQSLSDLNTASNQNTTYRKFDKTSEDPFSAAKAFRLRRELQENADYQNNLSDVDSQLLTAQSSMMSINKIVQEVSSGDCLQAINGTLSTEDRGTIAAKLRKLQDAIVSAANTKFSDKYVFGGANTDDPPFSVDTDGNLLFRGVDVNTGKLAAKDATAINDTIVNFNNTALSDYTIKVVDGGAGSADAVSLSGTQITVSMDLVSGKNNTDLLNALKNETGLVDGSGNPIDFSGITMTGKLDSKLTGSVTSSNSVGQAGLQQLAEETSFVDLGMGLNFKGNGSINTQSVFNTAIPGLSFLGFGTANGSGTGVSNNLYTLMGQIADQLESGGFNMAEIQPYLDNFSDQGQALLAQITKSGTNSTYLTSVKTRLESIGDSITEKDDSVEFIDPAEAIMNYKMQEYAYRAALQMGTNILQPTFLDFMD